MVATLELALLEVQDYLVAAVVVVAVRCLRRHQHLVLVALAVMDMSTSRGSHEIRNCRKQYC
jgi:hypothetical protein